MTVMQDPLAEQYAAALQDYLAHPGESALNSAYELGRKASVEGRGVLEMLSLHNQALATVFRDPMSQEQAVRMAERASLFFAESLAPFEMIVRGVRDANTALRTKIQQLQSAEQELSQQHRELVDALDALEAERHRYHELFHFAPGGYLVTDLDGIVQEANGPALDLLQNSAEPLVGQPLDHFVAGDEQDSFRHRLAQLRGGKLEQLNIWQIDMPRPGAGSLSLSLTAGVVRDPQGQPVGLRWLLRDVTEQKRIEEEREELRLQELRVRLDAKAVERLTFLAVGSAVLAVSRDYSKMPDSMASLSVPHLGDCCLVFLTDDEGAIQHFGAQHIDSQMAALLQKLGFHQAGGPLPLPISEVLLTLKPTIVSEIYAEWLESFACADQDLQVLRQMGFRSALLVPLIMRERSLGAVAFFFSRAGRLYDANDLVLAEELVRRCALFMENVRLYEQVVAEKEKAEEASKAKEEFVAILSHELRTPLMSVLGWARVLGRHPQIAGDQVLQEGFRSLEHNATNIARLVDDCLDITRISKGKIKLQKELLDLFHVVVNSLEAIWEQGRSKGIEFSVELSRNIFIWGDRTRLEEVILNLFTNAIKHTNEGGRISVSLRSTNDEIELEVTDNGIGIEPEFLDLIFQPFRQGTTAWFASPSGLGIGLSIAREIVKMHGGRVWAESAGKGAGSTFRVRLPLAKVSEQPQAEPAGDRPAQCKVRPLRVLFVEDSKDVLNLMKMNLEEFGYSVLTASNGTTALEIAQREIPEVIVSDIKMPGMDGYELIRQLRRMPQLSRVPAIAMSGLGMKKDVENALAAGYNAHLRKPVEAEDLSAMIQKLSSGTYGSSESEPILPKTL